MCWGSVRQEVMENRNRLAFPDGGSEPGPAAGLDSADDPRGVLGGVGAGDDLVEDDAVDDRVGGGL